MPHRLSYRPEIDGLRAVAVLIVLLFHGGVTGITGGYIGVDVFFVISGYLVTSLLLRDLQEGRFSMTDFWERRIRRIAPALFGVLLGTFAVGAIVLLSWEFTELSKSLLAVLGVVSNVFFWLKAGYFSGDSKEKPLLHTWSLSVEEQFYIALPLVLYLLYRFFLKKRSGGQMLFALGVAGVGTFAFTAFLMWAGKGNSSYFLLPTRLWELLMGSILAAMPPRLFPASRWAREGATWIGLGMILAAACLYTEATPFPGPTALAPCLGAALIIWGNGPHPEMGAMSGGARLLASRPMVFIGLISYSLYLWHWPLLAYARYLMIDSAWVRAGALALSLILAIASWRWIETPIRKRAILGSRRALFGSFAAAALLLTALASLAVWTRGMPQRFSGVKALNDATYYKGRSKQENAVADLDQHFQAALHASRLHQFEPIGRQSEGTPVRVVLWSDSLGLAVKDGIGGVLEKNGLRGEAICHSGLPPLVDYHANYSRRWGKGPEVSALVSDYILSHPDIRYVILMGAWLSLQQPQKEAERFKHALAKTLDTLRKGGKQVWVIESHPVSRFNIPKRLTLLKDEGESWHPTVQSQEGSNTGIAELRRRYPGTFVDPCAAFRTGESTVYRIEEHGISLYTDHIHLSSDAAEKYVIPVIEKEVIEKIVAAEAATPSL